jgi:hypothetical protein
MTRRSESSTPASAFLVVFILAIAILALPCFAQQQTLPADPSARPQTQPGDKGIGGPDEKNPQQDPGREKGPPAPPSGTSNDRLFFTLPNFLTLENAGHVPPLTTGQKFKALTRESFDFVNFPWFAFLAALGQAGNSEPGYGQGAQGYAKRFGSDFADGTIDNYTTGAILPSLLKQDPRYFQMGHGGFFHRTGYAVSRTFVTRADSGRSQINYSEILGSLMAGGISNAYHPAGDRTVTNTMKVWSTQLGLDTLTFVAKEFWPDLRRKLRGK